MIDSRKHRLILILFISYCFILFSIAGANESPIIEGDCNTLIEVEPNGIGSAFLDIFDPDPLDSIENISIFVSPPPDGDYFYDRNFLIFYPTVLDENIEFEFLIKAYDNHNAMAYCNITFRCYSFSEIEQYEIKIEFEDGLEGDDNTYGVGVNLGQHAYVNVSLDRGSEEMLGYDFLIAYDNAILTCFGASPNPEIYGSPGLYEWEYFTYRFVDNCDDDCPSGLLRFVGLADSNNGLHHPVTDPNTGYIKVIPANTTLFTLDFLLISDHTYDCTFIPISFFWRDCSDNIILMGKNIGFPHNTTQAISKDVFVYNGSYFSITDLNATFPTYFGAPEECLEENLENPPLRFIDYKNGGIKIVCCCEIDERGDVNLNGVKNEIADAVVFINYFIYGLASFKINEEGQKAATDVNADGRPLTIEDLVYLIWLAIGDDIPISQLEPDSSGQMIISEYYDSLIVETSFDIPLGAVSFIFGGIGGQYDIILDESIEEMHVNHRLFGDTLKILIYSLDRNPKQIPAGKNRLLKIKDIADMPKFISSQAAGYFSEFLLYKTSIIQVPDQLFLSQNYPNPFNSSTMIEFGLYKTGYWSVDIINISGQRVRTLSANSPAGPVQIAWDGTDENGQLVSSGVYFYRLKFEDQSKTKKMLLLK